MRILLSIVVFALSANSVYADGWFKRCAEWVRGPKSNVVVEVTKAPAPIERGFDQLFWQNTHTLFKFPPTQALIAGMRRSIQERLGRPMKVNRRQYLQSINDAIDLIERRGHLTGSQLQHLSLHFSLAIDSRFSHPELQGGLGETATGGHIQFKAQQALQRHFSADQILSQDPFILNNPTPVIPTWGRISARDKILSYPLSIFVRIEDQPASYGRLQLSPLWHWVAPIEEAWRLQEVLPPNETSLSMQFRRNLVREIDAYFSEGKLISFAKEKEVAFELVDFHFRSTGIPLNPAAVSEALHRNRTLLEQAIVKEFRSRSLVDRILFVQTWQTLVPLIEKAARDSKQEPSPL
jgi:hypothetical protein